MKDPRIEKLAKLLINYSVSLKKGEKILIEAFDVDYMLVAELVKEVYRVGGYPFVEMVNNRVQREILMGAGEEECKLRAKYAAYRMNDMDAYIGELSDIPAEARRMDAQYYSHPVHHEIRVKKTKWVVLRYPNPSMAQLADMSTEAFENFYFDVCTLDYSKMNRAMDALSALMNRTDKVRLVAPGTDLTFSIKGIGGQYEYSGRGSVFRSGERFGQRRHHVQRAVDHGRRQVRKRPPYVQRRKDRGGDGQLSG